MNDVHDKTRMFAQVPYDVLDTLKSANAIALYAILKRYAGANGKIHPGRKKLAEDMGFISMKPVDTALDELRKAGLVRTFPRFKDDDGHISYKRDEKHRAQTSNGYVIYDPPTPEVHTPYLSGAYPPTPEVHTPYTSGVHEGDTPEGDTPEGDPPVVPQRGTGGDRGFGEFWDTYPRHVGKPKAVLAYARAVKRAGEDAVLEGVHRFATDPNLPTEKQYIPYPTTWLNRDGWEDDPLPARGGRQEDRKSDQILQAVVDLDRDRQEGGFSWQAISQ